MNKLQNSILNVYKFFLKICLDNNLTFYAIGGTCIGAIRHKGFIPWDDDLDVAMPIDDFIKLRHIMKNETSEKFELIDYIDCNRFTLFFKIHDVTTTFIEKIESNDKRKFKGVFIDIFPMVGVPKNKEIANKYISDISYYYNRNYSFSLSLNERVGLSKIKYILIYLFKILFGKDFYAKKYDKLLRKYAICEENDILFPWRYPLLGNYCGIFSFSDFKEKIFVNFEDTKIYVPKNYDSYLKKDFGDYMKLPPKEKRVSIHDVAKIDLNKSFREYNSKDFK